MLTPLAAAMGLGVAQAQTPVQRSTEAPASSRPAWQDAPASLAGPKSGEQPITLQAREIRGRPDIDTVAEGEAEFRQGDLLIRADRLSYQAAEDLARAEGNVFASKAGNTFSGPEFQIQVEAFEGYFLNPVYFFSRTGGGGSAERVDFLGRQQSRLTGATYSSCRPDGGGAPAWVLSTDRIKLDFDANEGVAEGAVLRFYDVPILAAPTLSFPLTDARKSGWLPPDVSIDSKSGFGLHVPYYWNIAPQRDATFTPGIMSRRGALLGSEFRYLEPRYEGEVRLDLMPHDSLTGGSRHLLDFKHQGDAPRDVAYRARVLRVSDDDYWKDFGGLDTITPRLLPTDLQAHRSWTRQAGDWTTYARVQQWQVLQDPSARILSPYERSPQVGARYASAGVGGLVFGFETEFNRFSLPSGESEPLRATGSRVHALGSVSWPYVTPGWSLTPRFAINAASYALDRNGGEGPRHPSRVIPTLSLDSAWVLERDATWFGKAMRQTLEPRLLYVNTPYRDQREFPRFDSAERDFNFESIYTDNNFTGIDRVSDGHQLTAGVTTRLLDPATGAEAMRLGLVQRYLFRDQRVTEDDVPLTKRFSDLLLLGSTSVVPRWNLDASVQYSPDIDRTVRSVVGARYSPGPFRTLSATYRFARNSNEQIEVGWQWPVYNRAVERSRLAQGRGGDSCAGTLYSVGRINYSSRDSRITDSIVGFEYDAGCWIGRVVAERLSTGRSEATTRLLLQLELVGLSRLGSNPLKALRDNIPGYRLLREDSAPPFASPAYD